MCKKTLINRIKNASKIIPAKMSTITNKSVEKIKSTYEGIDTKNIYNKTK